ncbi:patatin-like phospholipase family protein [Pseudomonadota bacterium]
MFSRRSQKILVVIVSLLLLAGCSSLRKRTPVPAELTNSAEIPGIPNTRFWGDEWPKFSMDLFERYTAEEFQANFSGIYGKPHNYLAISGGGANGAFGAGLLAGWEEAGTRPEFTMVTGISTGALAAPFAFLGADYDSQIKKLYTTNKTQDLIKKRGVAAAFSDSIADTAPLREIIEAYINDDMIEKIAVEHKRGRRLFIGTMQLDAGRAMIWSIGAIAVSNHPEKAKLIHDVLLASSAIPVAFPPVIISVEAGGQIYDEMHVDGGTASQVFVYPAAIDWRKVVKKLKVRGSPNVYVIRNAFLDPDFNGVTRNLVPIASRSIDSLIRTQGVGDLYQIFVLCKRDGNVFNLAYIPSDFELEPTELFDPVYMSALYKRGFDMAKNGYRWLDAPPGLILNR